MELRVERDALADAVVWTARSLPARPPMQVLLGLLLETTEAGLSVSGFDYEVSSQISVNVTTSEPGRVLVPGRLLADIVRSLPAQPVDLQANARTQSERFVGGMRHRSSHECDECQRSCLGEHGKD